VPVGHPRSVESIALGDTQLTIVTTPHGELGGTLMTWLPWITGAAGLAFTATVALLAEGLTRRRDEQRDIAQTLQHSLLPNELPELRGVEVAARYQPGARGVEVGGDWYDVVPADDGTVLAVVGDVSGRGLSAATTMAALRFATNAYAVEGHPPEVILERLGGLLDVTRDGSFATTLCARLDVARGVLTAASAGHPPPVLIDDTGARLLELPVGPPIGVPASGPRRSVDVALPARGTLLAFTDGLFERRGEVIDVGLRRVLDAARGAEALPLDGLVATVVAEAGAGSEDDTVILGFRWGPQVPSSSGPTSATTAARSPSR
jgi:serine phosphatase RsbU (regulator of sigma subunit)